MAGVITEPTPQQQNERPKPDFVLQDQQQHPVTSITTQEYRSTPSMRNAKAIVVDLGSSAFRAGYSTMSSPCMQLPPMVARMRDADTGIRTFLIGQDALVSSARSTARPAYEGGIPNNPALMERLLDGALVNLGLSDEDAIQHRFVLTEAPCQPNAARALLMEILFEAYMTPGVSFGIDALFSYLYNRHRSNGGLRYRRENALILSCGYNSTHVLPLRHGKLDANGIKRINVGGSHMTDQLTRRLQLLNSEHASALSIPRMERLKEKMCYVSDDYDSELTKLKQEVEYYNELTKSIRIPLPEAAEKSALSAEEQERQRQARIENGKRLSEMMREKRKAKAEAEAADAKDSNADDGSKAMSVEFTEEEVADFYAALKSWYELERISEIRELDEDNFYVALVVRKFKDVDAFNKELEQRHLTLEDERKKLGEAKQKSVEEAWWKRIHEDELLSMSDSELNPAELKKKRHVRALRGAAEARDRTRRAKELEKQEEERKASERRKMREEHPKEYLSKLKSDREMLAGRIKKRVAAKEAGSDRRSLAARERMRLLAQHAGSKGSVDEGGKGRGRGPRTRTPSGRFKPKDKAKGDGGGIGNGSGATGGVNNAGAGDGANAGSGPGGDRPKRKRGPSKKSKSADNDDEDDFGWNDEDWDVYRSMKVGADSDSDDNSAEEREQLDKIREEIKEMDPDEVDPTISHPEGAALLYEDNPQPDELPLCVDRLRTGELLFQPTLAGIEQCGLAEAIAMVSQCGGFGGRGFSGTDDDRASVVKEVFLTGGVASMRGLKKRVCVELRKILPEDLGDQAIGGVRVAGDPNLDAWRGAALFAERGEHSFRNGCVTRSEYEEMGSGYLKEHAFSNRFFATPVLSAADLELKKKMAKQASKRGGRARGIVG